jgi:DNA adenine methylase
LPACEAPLPLLKWPGGKRWAAAQIASLVRGRLRGTYIEPFLGGAAVFFQLRPKVALLGDINSELVATYRTVCDHTDEVIRALKRLPVSEKDYYRIRGGRPRSAVSRAARFLYLNRTAFSGMYRVNREGRFNVPYGGGERTPHVLWETSLLRDAASTLTGASIVHADFQTLLDAAGRGDVAYCDPTYTVAHDSNGFVRYNERNFSWFDQERLARAARAAVGRGAAVIVSNAHNPAIEKLYHGATTLTLERKSRVSADPTKRRQVTEYLFVLS